MITTKDINWDNKHKTWFNIGISFDDENNITKIDLINYSNMSGKLNGFKTKLINFLKTIDNSVDINDNKTDEFDDYPEDAEYC